MEIRLNINSASLNPLNKVQKDERISQSKEVRKEDFITIQEIEKEVKTRVIPAYKASLALDEEKNVVIKITDSEGNLIRQIPPEEYLKMVSAWKENIKNLFHLEV